MRIRDFDEPPEGHPGDDEVAQRFAPTSEPVAPTPVAPTNPVGATAETENLTTTTSGFAEDDDPYGVVVSEALKLRDLGFTILPVKTGSKDPSSLRWEEATANDPAVFLRNPGTHNYGILPPPGCFCWDVDGGVPEFLQAAALTHGPLPETRVHQSPHGQHWFFRWPKDLPRPSGPMFTSIVTRWPFGDKGQGYVVGPGSVLANGHDLHYSVLLDGDIGDFPVAWAQAALASKPPKPEPKPLAEVRRERKNEGERHEYLRDQARFLYGRYGWTGPRLFEAIWAIYLDECEPYLPPKVPRDEVIRAIGDPTQFERDEEEPQFGPASEAPPDDSPLFADLQSLKASFAEQRLDPYLIDRFVVNNGLTIIAGHPKSMKSLALMQGGFSFAAGRTFLGMSALSGCYPVFAYVTEEGSRYEMGQRLSVLEGAYPEAATRFVCAYLKEVRFDKKGYERVREGLLAIERRFDPIATLAELPLRVLMAFDPLRDFFPVGLKYSENDAQVMGMIKAWNRALLNEFGWLSIVLVHHLRKQSEGDTGLEMAGSGATYGAVDSTITWKRDKTKFDDRDAEGYEPLAERVLPAQGRMLVETRGDATWGQRWNFNPGTGMFQREEVVLPKVDQIKALIILAGTTGITATVISEETGIGRETVGARCRELARDGVIVSVGKAGRGNELRYFAAGMEPATLEMEEEDDIVVDPLHRL